MGKDDWYRNKEWNHEVEEAFFSKLKRARSQKTQYIKTQASMLVKRYPDIALKLVGYAREHCPDDFWEQELCLYESEALYNLNRGDEALAKAYKSIEWRIKKRSIQTNIPLWLSELVLKMERKDDYKKCLEFLLMLHSETPFPYTEFYFHGYCALLYKRLGDDEKARQEALTAIFWAEKDKNILQNKRKRKYGIFKAKNDWPYTEILMLSRG